MTDTKEPYSSFNPTGRDDVGNFQRQEEFRRAEAKSLGLPEDTPFSAIYEHKLAAPEVEEARIEQAKGLGLPENASWVKIMTTTWDRNGITYDPIDIAESPFGQFNAFSRMTKPQPSK